MLEVKDINLFYGAAQALRGVSIAAEPGKVTCVLGRNGVGKTSLLRAMVGQYPISSGAIVFDGSDITGLKPYERARKGIGFVPQGREIFPLLTVEENLKTGFGPLKREDRHIPDDVFSLFPVLQSMLGRRGGDLSGGQQQQLAIGRALVMRPKLLLLDRADRGHPALDHQGHRPRHLLLAQPRQHRHRAGRTISRLCLRTRRQFRRDGSRRGEVHLRPHQSRRERDQPSDGSVSHLCRDRLGRRMRSELSVTSSIFEANRARGAVRFDVHARDGVTRRGVLHESGSLRVRFPSPEDEGLSGVFVNTAGGVAGGDRFDVEISAADAARLTLTTAAAEKVYRAQGPAAELNIALKVGAGAHLSWLPQETILFDRARVHRRFDIALDEAASLLLCEIVVFGRTAMGERMEQGEFVDRWRLSRGGRLVFAETVRLGGDIGAKLARSAVAKGGAAIGTALIVPGDEALIERIREASESFAGEVGISAWNGFAMARFCAQDAARLRADMMAVLARTGAALPRLWLN
ncbi:urease accessory protein UreH/ABC-type Na+ transport system ATPase subunit NatA [Bradyrhizobium diazoefficiens]